MRKLALSILIAGFLLASGAWIAAHAAPEATITVTTTQDTIANDGLCSLREAVIAANTNTAYNDCPAGGATDIINLDPGLGSPAVFLLTRTGAAEDAAQTGDLDVFGTVTINGFGAGSTILDGNQSDRVLDIRPAARVYVNGVTLRYGNPGAAEGGGAYVAGTGRLYLQASEVISNTATAGAGVKSFGLLDAGQVKISANQGGGIKNDGGLLILNNTQVLNNSGGFGILNQNSAQMTFNTGTVSGNTSGGIRNADGSDATLSNLTITFNTGGGGIHNKGTATTHLTLSSSTIANNSATSGAGILNEGIGAVASITNTTIRNNTATAGGGGINNSGNLDITRSTLDHNQARSGGGIDHIGSSLTLTNVTISQNTVSDNGGGLYNRTTASLNFVTMVSNSAGAPGTGGNLYNDGDSTAIAVHNTIIADGGTAENCANNLGQINSLGYNLEDADTCFFDAAGDKPNTNPQLGPLQDNGGLTYTHALLVGSQAIDSGHSTGCSGTTDQRGISRPQGATCDIGAYELIFGGEANLSLAKVDEVDPIIVGGYITYTLTVSNAGPDSALNTVLTDNLPGGVSFASATPSQGSCGQIGQVVTCNLGTIASLGSASVELVATATSAGVKVNTASVNSNTTDPGPANNTASQSTTVYPACYLPLAIKG